MSDAGMKICDSDKLESGGAGYGFFVSESGAQSPAFVVRHEGAAYAYVNRCPHLMLELDWEPGEFFDTAGEYLICSNHGALFEPATGLCVDGPCTGASLVQLEVEESDGAVALKDGSFAVVADSDSA